MILILSGERFLPFYSSRKLEILIYNKYQLWNTQTDQEGQICEKIKNYVLDSSLKNSWTLVAEENKSESLGGKTN